MDLLLVRHAIAEPRDSERWPDDALRPLSPSGVERFRAAAQGLRRLGVSVDAVLTSPYLRASQTALLLTEESDWPVAEGSPALEPGAEPADVLRMLETRLEASLGLVGHEPELSGLASLVLAGGESAVGIELKKGGVISMRFAGRPEAGAAVLRWSASPKMLRWLGG